MKVQDQYSQTGKSQDGADVSHMALLELYPIHLASLLLLVYLHGMLVFYSLRI